MPLAAGSSAACQARRLAQPGSEKAPATLSARASSVEEKLPVPAPSPAWEDAADDRRDPVLMHLGQSDPELQTEGPGDLLGEERAHGAPGDPAHDLADQPPVGRRVIAVRGARLPERRLRFQCGDHRLPGLDLGRAQCGVDGREPGLMGEQEEDGDLLLPPTGRTRASSGTPGTPRRARPAAPAGSRTPQWRLWSRRRPAAGCPGHTAGRRRHLPLAVEGAAVEVDDLAPVHVQAEGRPRLVPGLEVLAEGVLDHGEAGLDVSSDAHVHDVVLSSRRGAGWAGRRREYSRAGEVRPGRRRPGGGRRPGPPWPGGETGGCGFHYADPRHGPPRPPARLARFRAEVRQFLEEHLVGEFAELGGRGGSGDETFGFDVRLRWEKVLAAEGGPAWRGPPSTAAGGPP